METTTLKSQYADLTFKSTRDFEDWLSRTTSKEIILSDLGQDMTKIWIDDKGEILHCDFHSSIYNGKFINLEELSEFCPLEIFENGEWKRMMGLLVSEIKSY